MKKCGGCDTVKPLTEFYKHKNAPDGLAYQCKTCQKQHSKKHREANREHYREYDRKRFQTPEAKAKRRERDRAWRAKNKEKRAAHLIMSNAIERGKIESGPCVICGSNERIHGHHEDYTKPLDVVWLCCIHHSAYHRGKIELP